VLSLKKALTIGGDFGTFLIVSPWNSAPDAYVMRVAHSQSKCGTTVTSVVADHAAKE
jgi:hypothetical protein